MASQTSRARCWGATAPQTSAGEAAASPAHPRAAAPRTPRETGGLSPPRPPWGTTGTFGGQVGPELVPKALVVIFVIYAKNDAEWWYREPLGRSVSPFPSKSLIPNMELTMSNDVTLIHGLTELTLNSSRLNPVNYYKTTRCYRCGARTLLVDPVPSAP